MEQHFSFQLRFLFKVLAHVLLFFFEERFTNYLHDMTWYVFANSLCSREMLHCMLRCCWFILYVATYILVFLYPFIKRTDNMSTKRLRFLFVYCIFCFFCPAVSCGSSSHYKSSYFTFFLSGIRNKQRLVKVKEPFNLVLASHSHLNVKCW